MYNYHPYLTGWLAFCCTLLLWSCNMFQKESLKGHPISAKFSARTPIIDGIPNDPCWDEAPWHPINQVWLGDSITPEDFSGRFKLLWTEDFLFVLAEIQDDTLVDSHPDGLDSYWDDDCLEIFVDEDASGGNHQYNYDAFAYHIALDNQVVDIGPDSLPHYYNEHIHCRRYTAGNISTWELAVALYPDTYKYETAGSTPVSLKKGKRLGFALAYCDNDGSPERENFIGSTFVAGEDKNRGWIDAGIFQPLILE